MFCAMALRTVIGTLRICAIKAHTGAVCMAAAPALHKSAINVAFIPCRHVGFMNSVPGNKLWEGVVSVSNAGRKRGRGKRTGMKRVTDLNKGQVLGKGKANLDWPGLTTQVLMGNEILNRRQLEADPDREARLVQLRDSMSKRGRPKMPALLRGWSGAKQPGQSCGRPDPIADYTFDDFDSIILEFKQVAHMTGTLGKKIRHSVLVVTGNKNGLIGYGLGKSQIAQAAIRVAKNRAGQNLVAIPRFENHTVYHNMYTKYLKTSMFIHKREKGYGLVCHRALKTICQLAGISDLYVKVEGRTTNIQALTKGFIEALINQETHQALADRTGYHVVEFREERDNFPEVVASPSDGLVEETELRNEDEDIEMDFDRLYYGGKVEYRRPPKKPFYHKLRSYCKVVARRHKRRNQAQVQLLRNAGLA